MGHKFERYCKDYENIENYEAAKKDNFKGWHCHHRLETHTPDGERREVDIGYKELKALGIYYNRPAEELIFLTTREHSGLHTKGKQAWNKGKKMSEEFCRKNSESHKGKHASDETRRKMSAMREGEKHPMYGKHHSEETRNKISEAKKGKHHTEDAKKKMSAQRKGMRFFNNGKINKRAKECPPGFIPGRLRK